MKDYIPIDCALYSRYELAILHHERLQIVWRDTSDTCHVENLFPIDLQTLDHAEYLLAENDAGDAHRLRLDQIVRVKFDV